MAGPARSGDIFQLNPLERLVRLALIGIYRLAGWQAIGELPPIPKFVIMGASHTSNWDFLVFVGTVSALGRQVRFIAKDSLFRWPMGGFMRALGGVPVDRSAPQDLVSQIVAEFEAHDEFVLVFAPEGTRSRTTSWKTGFYQIALRANVPIVCAGPDYPSRRGVIGPVIQPTGDYAGDLKPAFQFFRTLVPRHPERSAFPEGS
ncbi:MAG: lysophospholipid acyltransferase family protein [Sphingomonas sp.]|nr:lysophospholipid acyltransferase family protein [Sphingomonas sp.]